MKSTLFNNPINCYDYSVDDRQMGKEHWWNDNDKGKLKYLKCCPNATWCTTHPTALAWN